MDPRTVPTIGLVSGPGLRATQRVVDAVLRKAAIQPRRLRVSHVPPMVYAGSARALAAAVGAEVAWLEQGGADVVVVASAVAHAQRVALRGRLQADQRFVDLVDTTCSRAWCLGAARPGVLVETRAQPLYVKGMEATGLSPLSLHEAAQRRVDDAIADIRLGGCQDDAARRALADAAQVLLDNGADHIVFGSLDVPVVLPLEAVNAPVTCAVEALVTAVLARTRSALSAA